MSLINMLFGADAPTQAGYRGAPTGVDPLTGRPIQVSGVMDENVGPDIMVERSTPTMVEQDIPSHAGDPRYELSNDAGPNLNNSGYIEEAARVRDLQQKSNPGEHKGMFGVKGTLRDILGLVGDSWLQGQGGKAIYAPQRAKERMSDAMAGFTSAPLGAIERLAAAGFPEEAAALEEKYQTGQYKRSIAQSQDEARRSMIDKRGFDIKEAGMDRVLRWTKGGLPYNQIEMAAQSYGISPQELASLGITPDMSPEQRALVAAGDLSVNQSMVLDQRERFEPMKERGRMARDNPPPAPRLARAPTMGDRTVAAFDTPANQRTAEQQKLVDRATAPPGSGRGKSVLDRVRERKASGGTGKMVFRGGKFVPAN